MKNYSIKKLHMVHKCVYALLPIDVIYVFSRFYIFSKKTSNAKYKYAKIQRKILLEDALAMIFIDFSLLRSPYCKISYLRADITIRVKNLTTYI